jgi:SAM-dependent methyltransferase
MTASQPQAVNHHADRPGFSGLTGLLAGAAMLVAARPRARLIIDLAAVSDSDRVVDIGCGPGTAVRAAARRGAQVSGVDPAPVMRRLARAITGDDRRVACLAPAGRFLVIERRVRPDANGLASHGWTEQQAESFAAQCRAAGLESVRVEQRATGRHSVWVVRAIRP